MEIERAAGAYVLSAFSLQQIGETFLLKLKQGGYSSRLKKIEVPEQYDSKCDFAKEGISWLLLLALKEGATLYT